MQRKASAYPTMESSTLARMDVWPKTYLNSLTSTLTLKDSLPP